MIKEWFEPKIPGLEGGINLNNSGAESHHSITGNMFLSVAFFILRSIINFDLGLCFVSLNIKSREVNTTAAASSLSSLTTTAKVAAIAVATIITVVAATTTAVAAIITRTITAATAKIATTKTAV